MLRIALCLLLFVPGLCWGQMNRPTMDDAMLLADVLKKDYRSIASKVDRDEALVGDMNRALDVLKAYIGTTPDELKLDQIDNLKKMVDKENYILSKVASAPGKDGGEVSAEPYKKQYDTVIKARENLVKEQMNQIIAQLRILLATSGEDPLLRLVIWSFQAKCEQSQKGKDAFAGINETQSITKSGALLGAGGTTFTLALDAFATYLAERLQQELALEIANRMSKEFTNPERPFKEIAILLPTTVAYLTKVPPTDIPNLVEHLKQRVKTDLDNLLDNSPKLLKEEPYRSWCVRYPELSYTFDGIRLIKQLSKVNHPLEVFAILEQSPVLHIKYSNPESNERVKKVRETVQLMALVSNGLKVSQNGTGIGWVNLSNLQPYLRDPNFVVAWFGLLLKQGDNSYKGNDILADVKKRIHSLSDGAKDIQSQIGDSFLKITNDKLSVAQIEPIAKILLQNSFRFEALLLQAEILNDKVQELQRAKKNGTRIEFEQIYDFTLATLEMVDSTLSAAAVLTSGLENPQINYSIGTVRRYLSVGKSGTQIYKQLKEKHYANAISTILELMPAQENQLPAVQYLADVAARAEDVSRFKVLLSAASFTQDEFDQMKKDLSAWNTSLGKPALLTTFIDGSFSTLKPDAAGKYSYALHVQFTSTLTGIQTTLMGYLLDKPGFGWKKIDSLITASGLRKEDQQALREFRDRLESGLTKVLPGLDITLIKDSIKAPLKKLVQSGALTQIGLSLASKSSYLNNETAVRYINFFGTLAAAQTKEELKEGFKTLFEGPGSWMKKRTAEHSVTFNAFAGVGWGWERARDNGKEYSETWNSVGVMAPVGVAYSWTPNWKNSIRIPGSFSVFVSVIDVGAVSWLRFKGDTASLPALSFTNIIAPGLHLIWGIPSTGVSLAVYGQIGPLLREVNKSGEVRIGDNHRIGLAAYYDLPLQTIWRSKKRK